MKGSFADSAPQLVAVIGLVVILYMGVFGKLEMPEFSPAPTDRSQRDTIVDRLRRLQAYQKNYFDSVGRYAQEVPAVLAADTKTTIAVTQATDREWSAVGFPASVTWATAARRSTTPRDVIATKCTIVGRAESPVSIACGGIDALLGVQPRNALDSAVASLPIAGVAFDAPKEMFVNRPTNVVLVLDPRRHPEGSIVSRLLSPQATDSLIGTLIELGGNDSTPHETAVVHYSPRMQAELRGQAFAITPRTPEEDRGVSGAEPTVWRWEVTPKEIGTHVLALTISAVIPVNGEAVRKAYPVLDRRIEVKSKWAERMAGFVGDNWQWLLGTLLIPAFVYWWKNRKRNRGARARRVSRR
jgi:hypothetical protein